jgi:hypothetical protein
MILEGTYTSKEFPRDGEIDVRFFDERGEYEKAVVSRGSYMNSCDETGYYLDVKRMTQAEDGVWDSYDTRIFYAGKSRDIADRMANVLAEEIVGNPVSFLNDISIGSLFSRVEGNS